MIASPSLARPLSISLTNLHAASSSNRQTSQDLERSTDMYCRGLVSYIITEMDTACCICEKRKKSSMSDLAAVVLAVHLLFLWTSPVSAYVWRCHSPHGDFWTTAPKESDYCEEYDSIYNPDAAPPMAKQRTAMEFTTPERGTKDKVLFTQQELDQMLAPLALYPDSLLSQILMAATYPLEIVEA